MAQWIRWQGVVAFVVVTGILAGVWFLLVDRFVERAIEHAGTTLIGAKVELDAADVTLFPLGLTLTRLQVTNPEEPMTNAVEIGRIAGTLDALNLLRRKVIVEELAAEGLRLNTQRTTSGAVGERARKEGARSKDGPRFTLPSAQLNDPKEILEKELDTLVSLKQADTLRADVQAEKDKWQKRLAELPDKAKLDEYKKRLDGLKSAGKGGLGGLLGGVGEVRKIQEDLTRDLDRITGAKKDLEEAVASLRKRANDVVKAPQEDVKRLMDKYSFSGQGLANVTRTLFAGPLVDYMDAALRWRRRLEPFLSRPSEKHADIEVVKPVRGKGVDVRFKEQAPLPDLLIRTARVSIEIPAGAIQGRVQNISPEQHILGAPTTFSFSGAKLKGIDSITLDGSINRVNPAKPADTANLKIGAYRLDSLSLGGEGAPVTLKGGVADLDLRASLSGPVIEATVDSRVRSVRLTAGEKLAGGPVGAAIVSALADISAFQVNAKVAGTQEQYDVQLTSDIDRALQAAVAKQAKAQVAKFEGSLRAAIEEKVKARLGEVQGTLGGFDSLGQELAGRLNLGRDLLKFDAGGGGAKSGFKLPF